MEQKKKTFEELKKERGAGAVKTVSLRYGADVEDKLVFIAQQTGHVTRTGAIMQAVNTAYKILVQGGELVPNASQKYGSPNTNKEQTYVPKTAAEKGEFQAEKRIAAKKRADELFKEEKLAVCEYLDGRYNEVNGTCTFNFYDKQMNTIVRSEQRMSLSMLNDSVVKRAFGADGKEAMLALYEEKKAEGLVKDL